MENDAKISIAALVRDVRTAERAVGQVHRADD